MENEGFDLDEYVNELKMNISSLTREDYDNL